jgi:WD40 repeat protein
VAFSPDGNTLASASVDKTVRLWNVSTHQQLGAPLTGHTDGVIGVAFSPDGNTLASASDHNIRLWDIASHVPLGPALDEHGSTVYAVAFSPDGRTLASSADKTIRLWSGLFSRDFAQLKDEACSLVGTGLSENEWARYAPAIPSEESCP